MKRSYSQEIAATIRNFMDSEDYKYTFDPDRGIFKAGFALSNDSILGNVEVVIRVNDTDFSSSGLCPINAPSSRRNDTANLLTRLNWVLRNGNFEMDYSDGEIRYKVYHNCAELLPSNEVLDDAIGIPAAMFSQYGQCIVDVVTGVKTPEQAFEDRKTARKSAASESTDLSPQEISDILQGLLDDPDMLDGLA